jgi:hypothetical protein
MKFHIYLHCLKYLSLYVTANAMFFKSGHIKHIYLLMAVVYFVLFIVYIKSCVLILFYTMKCFTFSVSGYFILMMFKEKS